MPIRPEVRLEVKLVGIDVLHETFEEPGVPGELDDVLKRYATTGFPVEVAVNEDMDTGKVEVVGRVKLVMLGGVAGSATNSFAPMSHAPLEGRVFPTMSQVKG